MRGDVESIPPASRRPGGEVNGRHKRQQRSGGRKEAERIGPVHGGRDRSLRSTTTTAQPVRERTLAEGASGVTRPPVAVESVIGEPGRRRWERVLSPSGSWVGWGATSPPLWGTATLGTRKRLCERCRHVPNWPGPSSPQSGSLEQLRCRSGPLPIAKSCAGRDWLRSRLAQLAFN